jgi:3-oxoadipate enol-lactonase
MRRIVFAGALLVFGVTCARYAGAQVTQQAGARGVPVGDARINCEITGSGPVVVLIHGWALDLTVWDDQIPVLARGHRVLRYDLRGFGGSTGHADITGDADDLRTLLDSLGIRSAYVVGLSRGSRVALDFAVAFPERVRALVLYGPTPPAGFQPLPPGPGAEARFGEIARRYGLDSVRKLFSASPVAWNPPNRPDVDARLARIWSRYDGRDLLDPGPATGRVPQARVEQLSSIRVPTLVIVGDHESPLLRAVGDTLIHRIPGARMVVIPDAGHGAHLHQPERFNRELLAFLESVERGR